jgi:hypothetical protein
LEIKGVESCIFGGTVRVTVGVHGQNNEWVNYYVKQQQQQQSRRRRRRRRQQQQQQSSDGGDEADSGGDWNFYVPTV